MNEEEKTNEHVRQYVLLAEDDSLLRTLLIQKFEQEGFEITGAVSGKDTIEKMGERNPDVLLLDLLLPDINGFEVLEYIKGNETLHSIPVLAISNLSNKEDMDRSLKLGAEYFLAKEATTTTEIVNKVREILLGKK